MKTAIIKQKRGKWYCDNCMMIQPELVPQCVFCEIMFSNYESEVIRRFKEKEEDRRKNESNVFGRN